MNLNDAGISELNLEKESHQVSLSSNGCKVTTIATELTDNLLKTCPGPSRCSCKVAKLSPHFIPDIAPNADRHTRKFLLAVVKLSLRHLIH